MTPICIAKVCGAYQIGGVVFTILWIIEKRRPQTPFTALGTACCLETVKTVFGCLRSGETQIRIIYLAPLEVDYGNSLGNALCKEVFFL